MSAQPLPVTVASSLTARFGTRAAIGASLGSATWYRVGGPCAALVDVRTVEEAAWLARLASDAQIDLLIHGQGSNTLVSDGGINSIVLRLDASDDCKFSAFDPHLDTGRAVLGGSAFLPKIARVAAAVGAAGLSWAAGIPGTVGGSVRMNAGVARDEFEMANYLVEAEVLDLASGHVETRRAHTLGLGYRTSALTDKELVLSATMAVEPGNPVALAAENEERINHRNTNQETKRTGGSVWTNPDGLQAFQLILDAGCGRLRVGTAQVSSIHANFIVADRGGRADDIFQLMAHCRTRVHETSGIWLHPENELLGFGPLPGGA